MNWFKRERQPEVIDAKEELKSLREATEEVKRAAKELQETNEALRRRLDRMEERSIV